jgi:hypothetical protein
VRVLRSIRAAEDGLPGAGETGRYLGVRPDVDLPVGVAGFIEPGTGGMSVVPPPVTNLARHRLPRELGGTGRDPVFELDTDELPEELTYRPDPENPEGHGFLEPSRRMSFVEYQQAVYGTRVLWHRLHQDVR